MELKERVLAAAKVTEELCLAWVSTGIPADELAILTKYRDNGMIKFVNTKAKHAGRDLYLPLMVAPEYKRLSSKLLLYLTLRYIAKHKVAYPNGKLLGLTKASVVDYMGKFDYYAHRYSLPAAKGVEYEDLKGLMTVVSEAAIGKLGVADDMGAMNELIEEGKI